MKPSKDMFNFTIAPRTEKKNLFYFQKISTINLITKHHLFLHMSGETFTSDFNLAWFGTKEQAENIKFYNKSNFKLFNKGVFNE